MSNQLDTTPIFEWYDCFEKMLFRMEDGVRRAVRSRGEDIEAPDTATGARSDQDEIDLGVMLFSCGDEKHPLGRWNKILSLEARTCDGAPNIIRVPEYSTGSLLWFDDQAVGTRRIVGRGWPGQGEGGKGARLVRIKTDALDYLERRWIRMLCARDSIPRFRD